ncbi:MULTISPECIES: haloacid dehalogenase type II [Burkholderiaceae]|uniref:Haloacid dehalogenase type II n=1 Tax=Burkholderia cepacia TaxID=292 RepID=A0A8I1AR72_BURCE|nr:MULTISPECIES: haloacid dehalogenase type II [Burkholderiaceae]MBB0025150.1 haloacid dehalogenase type II [Ralstonia pickettii]MBB0035938.1 haloacid dehalogenase type II [Ralstonia pickettii]MBB0098478.1 haloacid dehalogenase type II [Ralstonia pickettii]MBB0108463.1 haloacid dehalogenase type II [Ralstonia pickettii]MBB0129252.1 haloacid dehalogenase type II [Ralstonia pickettii]
MQIKAVAFDTGGTVLDWHSGVRDAFAAIGRSHGVERDWGAIANQYRRLAMKSIVGQCQPSFNMDDVHFRVLNEIFESYGLQAFSNEDQRRIAQAWHKLSAWGDFADPLREIRSLYPVVSFTMLPLSLVVDVSRLNGISWDAVISCEAIGYYKPDPRAYLQASKWLGIEPSEILMVACHNFDLNAARACGFQTAFVRRPNEWGCEPPPDPIPNPDCDFALDNFEGLFTAVRSQVEPTSL